MDILTKKTIVLIEDNLMLADIIIRKLSNLDIAVKHYTNGLEGLSAIREFKPDLVLLDIMLPVMNGYEVLQVMQSEGLTETHPVLVISNSGQPIELSRVQQLGAKDYLIKADFTPEEVIEKARVVLHNCLTAHAKDTDINNLKSSDTSVTDPTAKSIRVLVIEDDPMLRNILSMKFSVHKLVYMFVSDGNQALETAISFKPDVIILDLMLPGLHGFEIFALLKEQVITQSVPVIIFSNKSDETDRQTAINMGAAAYLVKAMTDLNDLVKLAISASTSQKTVAKAS